MADAIRENYFPFGAENIDPLEAAEQVAADLLSFRVHPHRGPYFAVSIVRSQYQGDALAAAARSHQERTAAQLDSLAVKTLHETIDFIAFCTGYLAARMFLPAIGASPNLARFLLPADHAIADDLRKQSIAPFGAVHPCPVRNSR